MLNKNNSSEIESNLHYLQLLFELRFFIHQRKIENEKGIFENNGGTKHRTYISNDFHCKQTFKLKKTTFEYVFEQNIESKFIPRTQSTY